MRPTAKWLSHTNDVTATFLAAAQIPDLINLAGGLPDPSVWPVEPLAQLSQEVLRDDTAAALGYGPVPGLPQLRNALAQRFSTDQLRLTADNILVTTGGTQALAAVAEALIEPGQAIAVQTPTYLGALDAWRARVPRYLPMALEAPEFDPRPAMRDAQFAYTVPNFSNPSGRLVDVAQRRALIEAARDTGCWLVEDDPYGGLFYDAPALPSMLALSAEGSGPGSSCEGPYDGPVIYLGTVSKELAPGLRIGWAIAAPEMITALAAAKQGMDMFSSGICQMITTRAMERGLLESCQEAQVALYRARRDAFCAALETHLSPYFTWEVPTGGMFVWAKSTVPGLDTDALMQRGLAEGVCVSPSSVFDPAGQDRTALRLNFTLNPPDRLEAGVARLARATKALLQEAAE